MNLSYLEPIAWLIGVFLLYFAIGAAAVNLLASRKVEKPAFVIASIVLNIIIIALFILGLRFGPFGIAATAALCSIVQILFWKFGLQPIASWQAVKYAREMRRQTILHLVLMSFSFIFLIPFAWLVVTSLKEDKEMSKFPPVWIPTQQVKMTINGEERGLATAKYKGLLVKVAIMQEFDTGVRDVQVVEPANLAKTRYSINKDDLTEIRRVAPVWKNYPNTLKFLPPESNNGLMFVLNTVQVSLLTIIGTLLSSAMVAYGFARLRWPGRDLLFMALLATMMLPSAVTMMPVFLIFREIGWIDTLKPLWVPAFFGSAFNIFLLRQFFLGIPMELEEAARIDGCSHYGIFWRIMLPQLKPALAALTIMAFMAAWNDFRGPLIYISSPNNQPLAYALQLFQTSRSGEPGLLMAASTMVMAPVLLLFFFTQRYFIEGITLTGIKG